MSIKLEEVHSISAVVFELEVFILSALRSTEMGTFATSSSLPLAKDFSIVGSSSTVAWVWATSVVR